MTDEFDDDDLPADGSVIVADLDDDDMTYEAPTLEEVAVTLVARYGVDEELSDLIFEIKRQRAIVRALRAGSAS